MEVGLSDSERQLLRQAQRACRGKAGYVPVTVLLLLDRGRAVAAAEAGEAVVYFADAAHTTHNTRATHVWTETGKERPLLTVSGRERVNLNAALNAHCPS